MPSRTALAGKKAIWTRIGAAWPHDKGAGLTVILDFLPVEPRIVLVEPKIDLPSIHLEKHPLYAPRVIAPAKAAYRQATALT